MKRNPLAPIVALPLLMFAWAIHAEADSPAPTTCKDGTTSTATGRGACSSHGGVQKSAAPAAAAPAATPPAASVPPPGAAAASTSPATTAVAPANATAKCKDGSYSTSKQHSGACSKHGGVAQWLSSAH